MKKGGSELGFSVVEMLLILGIIGILGFTGWYVYHAKQMSDKNYSAAANTTVPSYKNKTASKVAVATTNAYAGWKTGLLKYEQINFQYPSNWAVVDDSQASNLTNSCVTPGYDDVTLTSPSGHQALLRTGIDCIGDGGDKAYGAVPIVSLGQNSYVVLENTPPELDPTATGPAYACLAQTPTPDAVFFGYSKHISNGGNPGPENQFCYYPYESGKGIAPTSSTVSALEGSADFKTATLIFESMKYSN